MDKGQACSAFASILKVLSLTAMDCIADQIVRVLNKFGAKNFGAIVSDNDGGCVKGRQLTKQVFPHVSSCLFDGKHFESRTHDVLCV